MRKYYHALAKFNIKAKTVSAIDASTKVTIESIKITDSNNLSQTGTLNLVDGSWSNYGGKVLLTIGNTNINTNFAESLAREIQNTTDLATFEKIAGLKTDAQSVMIGDKSCSCQNYTNDFKHTIHRAILYDGNIFTDFARFGLHSDKISH